VLEMDLEYEYDAIAERIFYPIFPYIAEEILRETGIQEGETLDVGCGGGHLGFAVLDQASALRGTFLDIQQAAIRHAKTRAAERGLADRSRFFTGNVESLPFADESFDLVISRGSMPFWNDQKKAFSEIYRVLARGGRSFIGGSLGSPAMRVEITAKMKENGLRCFGDGGNDKSKSLSRAEYESFFESRGWNYRVYSGEGEGRWYILEKE